MPATVSHSVSNMSAAAETVKEIKKSTKKSAAAPAVAAPAVAAPAAAAPAPKAKKEKAVAAKTEVTVPVVAAAPAPAADAAAAPASGAAPTLLEVVENIRQIRARVSADLKQAITDALNAAKTAAREVKDARRKRRVKKDVADMTPEEKAAHELRRSKNAFLKPRALSAELCTFMSLPAGSQRSQTEVTKFVSTYVKSNNCFDPSNKRRIIPDGVLSRLLKVTDKDTVTYLNLQSYLKAHFPKAPAA
uniref:DM2 domain-containing protein n=1 Tax=viral metagenome TaxID=1070528 RepID=A0A6C0HKG6_9ZZZZ